MEWSKNLIFASHCVWDGQFHFLLINLFRATSKSHFLSIRITDWSHLFRFTHGIPNFIFRRREWSISLFLALLLGFHTHFFGAKDARIDSTLGFFVSLPRKPSHTISPRTALTSSSFKCQYRPSHHIRLSRTRAQVMASTQRLPNLLIIHAKF
jgi:hypothetical protein